ncbi:hypothetical protein BURPS305_1073 [Burkholderia pseudomallei 305]|nr:hypothetical protein BURPS305_1073 [Burkholderia pseudomallei 305]
MRIENFQFTYHSNKYNYPLNHFRYFPPFSTTNEKRDVPSLRKRWRPFPPA